MINCFVDRTVQALSPRARAPGLPFLIKAAACCGLNSWAEDGSREEEWLFLISMCKRLHFKFYSPRDQMSKANDKYWDGNLFMEYKIVAHSSLECPLFVWSFLLLGPWVSGTFLIFHYVIIPCYFAGSLPLLYLRCIYSHSLPTSLFSSHPTDRVKLPTSLQLYLSWEDQVWFSKWKLL